MIRYLVTLWQRKINPHLSSLMATIGLGGLTLCLFILLIVAKLSNEVLEKEAFIFDKSLFILACLGALILTTGMKLFFAKLRPQLWTSPISETSFSFPSGHALGSVVLYGLIAYLLSCFYPKFYKLIYFFSLITIILIGFSRLYLGVHWPTDIMAGYGIGFLWLIFCIMLLKLQKYSQQN